MDGTDGGCARGDPVVAAVTDQAAPEYGALPPAAADDDAFAALVLQAQANLAQSVEKAGLARDPYRFLMGALSHALGVLPAFMGRLDDAVDQARQPVDPAAVEQAVKRLEKAAVRGADQRAADLAWARIQRTLLIYGGAFAFGIVAAASSGFLWGRASANASVQQTEQRLALAFRDGPNAAAAWANLMQSNDVGLALAACTGAAVKTIEGRRACNVPLWLDPLIPSPPGARR